MKTITLGFIASALMVSVAFAGIANPPTTVISVTPGVPSNGTNSVQKLTFGSGITGGTFRVKVGALSSAAIAWSATNGTLIANVQSKVRAIPGIGVDGCVASAGDGLTAGIGDVVLTFSGAKTAKLAMPSVTVATNSLTGTTHTLVPSVVTAGVTADGRAFHAGSMCLDLATKQLYVTTHAGPDVAWESVVGGVGQPVAKVIHINGPLDDTHGNGVPDDVTLPDVGTFAEMAHWSTDDSAYIFEGTDPYTGLYVVGDFGADGIGYAKVGNIVH